MTDERYIIKIRKDEKRLNRIFNDLKKNGECIIDNNDEEWHTPMKRLGHIIVKKDLVNNGFLEPIWIHKNNQNNIVEKRLIRLGKNTEIEKTDGNDLVFFKFRRKRIL